MDRQALVERRTGWLTSFVAVAVVVAATTAGVVAVLSIGGVALLGLNPGDDVPVALLPGWLPLMIGCLGACWFTLGTRGDGAGGLAVVLLAWLLPALSLVPGVDPVVSRLLLAVAVFAGFGTGWAVRGSGVGPGKALLGTSFALAGSAALLFVLGYDPFRDPACTSTCASLPAPLADSVGPRPALGLATVACCASLAAAALAVRACRSSPVVTRLAGMVVLVLAAAAAVVPWLRWGASDPTVLDDLLAGVGVAVLSGAVLLAAVRRRRTRSAVREVVRRLAGPTGTNPATTTVSAVHFADADADRWVTGSGDVAPEPAGAVVHLRQGDRPAVRLVLAEGASADDVESALGPAARLALENTRLVVLGSVHLADLRASQRRLVATADAERSRLERDLHDSAQQWLVAADMQLRLASASAEREVSSVLQVAAQDVRSALQGLRRIAHGSYRGVLEAEGLVAALEDIVDDARVPLQVELEVADGTAVPADAGAAVVVTVAAIVSTAESGAGGDVTLRVVQGAHDVCVVAVVDQPPAESMSLVHAADRVGAAGGSWHHQHEAHRWTIRARVPCVSS